MARVNKYHVSGKLFELYTCSLLHKKGRLSEAARAKREKKTAEGKREINWYKSRMKLIRLLCLNFVSFRDIKVELTFAGAEPTASEAAAKVAKFFRQLKGKYGAAGLPLKFIKIKETHSKEGRDTRLHYHLIMNTLGGGKDLEVLREVWPHGTVWVETLVEGDLYEDTANYFLKERKDEGQKKWTCSQNLVRDEAPIRERVGDGDPMEVPPGVQVFEYKFDSNNFGAFGVCIGKIVDEVAFGRFMKRVLHGHGVRRMKQVE